MKRRLLNYINEMEQKEYTNLNELEKREVREKMLIQIQFFQHERLIHLIVTVTFAMLLMMAIIGFFLSKTIPFLILEGLLLVLLVPYIKHYYLLENGVQKLYMIYDRFC
ncbi:MAG: hypothetical protein PUC65_12205 [Clostridiales bacterium]|nr:hypothetical protein [Clostridiales bacterium]